MDIQEKEFKTANILLYEEYRDKHTSYDDKLKIKQQIVKRCEPLFDYIINDYIGYMTPRFDEEKARKLCRITVLQHIEKFDKIGMAHNTIPEGEFTIYIIKVLYKAIDTELKKYIDLLTLPKWVVPEKERYKDKYIVSIKQIKDKGEP